ncbi:hypothetical protein ACFVU2_19285 [Leifsonia sp. NPDC058194]|uniref:hypothetical protein n=1 Tax=Leifsonia sp. NPDC058194 TaxID=3346374 RepID=UPI0036DE85CE
MKIMISEPGEFESLVDKRVRFHVSMFASSDGEPYFTETHFGDVASVNHRVDSRSPHPETKIWMHGRAEPIQIRNDRFVTVEYELIDANPARS